MFEHDGPSPVTLHPAIRARREQLDALRQRIRQLESPQIDAPVFPVIDPLTDLFPEGGLRRGVVYEISEGRSLLWSLLAQASQAGHWIAIVGMGNLGVQAAADAGVDLERLVLVAHPGQQWCDISAQLADTVSLVVTQPSGPLPGARHRERLHARLRERGSTLIVRGAWPGHQGRIAIERRQWEGLGRGTGLLRQQTLTISHHYRPDAIPRRVDLCLSASGIHPSAVADITHLAPRVQTSPAAATTNTQKAAG